MSTQLQDIVDTLATQLKRAVAIDDPRLHLLAHSPHREPVDKVRLASIMNRDVPADVVDYVQSTGVLHAVEPVRVPANPALGLWSRICAPIRCESLLLGYLFFIDHDETCGPHELALAASAAHTAGMVLYQQRLLHEVERARERELVQDLLSGDPALRQNVAAEIIERGHLEPNPGVVVAVAQPATSAGISGGPTPAGDLRFAVTAALDDVRRGISPRHSMQLDRPGHGVLLIDTHDLSIGRRTLRDVAANLRTALTKRLTGKSSTDRVIVGVSEPAATLVQAQECYQQAKTAAHVASVIPSLGDIVFWSDLGIYQILSQMPPESLTKGTLHRAVARLLDTHKHGPLVETLETYLDHAGDAAATAKALSLHRSSLYYRLDKIRKLTGADLDSGHDRLALHLSLKIARLARLL
ncbi:PucR family transcriptional regulator [Streptomyces albus]|uniref:PucR family transcriptional regulator n=1 Tax=Streptomyces albus TaxID=1888 RepID=UPI0024AD9610|nr:helix-turn-helix domain-containing protein [Streptomyces albus]MDI6413642.1 helix-turn-helix domain-containing protein [Streptomyces albus]